MFLRLIQVNESKAFSLSDYRKPDTFSIASIWSWGTRYVREVFESLQLTFRRWQMDDGSSMAAAVAYYLALSVLPMLLLLTSGIGLFLKYTNLGHDAELQLLSVVHEHCSPSLEMQLRGMLVQFENQSLIGCPFGLCTATFAAIGVFYQFDRAFDKIWRVPKTNREGLLGFASTLLGKRLFAFVMMGGVGLTILAIMVANLVLSALRSWITSLPLAGSVAIWMLDATTTMALNALAFSILYRVLPKRPVRWKEAFRAALLVSLVWELGREFLCTFLIGMRYTTTYGAVGSFIALLLWFYWGVTLLFFGAEYLQVISLRTKKPLPMFDPENVDDRLEENVVIPIRRNRSPNVPRGERRSSKNSNLRRHRAA